MAYTTVIFKNPNTDQIRKAPVGFSWTVLFFGFWVPLFRRDWKWTAIMFLLLIFEILVKNMIDDFFYTLSSIDHLFFFIWFVIHLTFAFIYNKLYKKELINSGFIDQSHDCEII